MNRYYTKLDSISPVLYKDFKNLGEQHSCGGGWTKYYRTDLSRNILLPDHLKQDFNLSYMTFIGDNAHPHVDLDIGCRINIYLSENNCLTKLGVMSIKTGNDIRCQMKDSLTRLDAGNLRKDRTIPLLLFWVSLIFVLLAEYASPLWG